MSAPVKLILVTLSAALFVVATRPTPALSGEWSQYPECEDQFNKDREICKQSKRDQCWSSMNERLAYCNRTHETGKPSLLSD